MRPESFVFLLLPGFSTFCLANAVEPLRAANSLAGKSLYQWTLVSVDRESVASSSGIQVDVAAGLPDVQASDGLFVVSSYDYDRWSSAAFKARFRRAAAGAAILGGLDTGAWLLAEVGLLDGYRATIHWEERGRLEEAFPSVNCTRERYVIDRDRITAGGATTVLDLMLRLVRAHHGDVLALEVMRMFIYDQERQADRPQQGPLATPLVEANPAVGRAIRLMEDGLEAPLSLPEVARGAGCSQRQLERGFIHALEQTPQQYYLLLRLAEARRLILRGGLKLAEVAARTGFNSSASFSRAFRRLYGETPRAVKTTNARALHFKA